MLDVMVLREGYKISRILKKNEDGSVEEVSHRPWFIAADYMHARGIVDAYEEDVEFYKFNESSWRYELYRKRSWRIEVEYPSTVRRISGYYEDHGIPVSLNNIRYEARVSMDFADRLFGVKLPLPHHYSLNELEQVVREILEKSKNIKVLGFDIEVKAEGSFPKPGEEVFLVSACWGELGSDTEECVVLEKEDIFNFLELVQKVDPHYIVGFNSSEFDIPYLTSYVPLWKDVILPAGIVYQDKAVPHIDLINVLDAHGSAFGLPFGARLSLDDVAERLGLASEEEIEIESSIDRNRIWLEYQRDREKVIKYSETDAKLTFRLGRFVLRVLLQLYALSGIAPSIIQLLPSLGSIAEYTVTDYLYRKKRKVLECRWVKYTAKELEDGFAFYRKGVKVFTPTTGYFENVGYYDFNMLYPTIYYQYRLDPINVRLGNGFLVYLLEKKEDSPKTITSAIPALVHCVGGDVNEILSYFFSARKISKKLKNEGFKEIDMAIKILANSAYGMFSKARGNGVNEILAAFIFFKSNQIAQNIRGYLKNRGFRVIYGDTDSFFVLLNGYDAVKLEEELNRVVKARFGDAFGIKLEAICRKLAILRTKTYVCLSDDEMIIKGMERLELPVAIKMNMGEILKRVIEGESWAKVLDEYLGPASVRDLFIKASRRLSELYDEDEGRFKNLNSNRSKAIVIKYLLEQGISIDRQMVIPFEFRAENLEDIPIIAYYLKSDTLYGKRAIVVLRDELEDGAETVECALIESKATKDLLSGRFICRPRRLIREKLRELAMKSMEAFIEYLKDIESMTKQRKLL